MAEVSAVEAMMKAQAITLEETRAEVVMLRGEKKQLAARLEAANKAIEKFWGQFQEAQQAGAAAIVTEPPTDPSRGGPIDAHQPSGTDFPTSTHSAEH